MRLTPNHLAIVPVLSTLLIVGVACKSEDRQNDKATIYTYELSAQYTPSVKAEIGARYTYGSRSAKMSSKSGKVTTKLTTAGPKKVNMTVTSNSRRVLRCLIVVKKDGNKITTIENTGSNSINCTFNP